MRGGRFEQDYIYPEEACREALVNSLAHRDYSVQNGIEIVFYDDRIDIKSPGELLSTVQVEDIQAQKGVHESRNSLVARVLRESSLMRELGEGFQRIFRALAEHELDKPSILSQHGRFSVVISNRSVFSAKQEAWISLFESYELSTLEKKIVVLGMDGREISPNDIYAALNTSDRNVYDKEVTGLRTSGILDEIRTNLESATVARVKRVDKKSIPRFAVRVPSSDPHQENLLGENLSGGLFVRDRSIFVGNVARGVDHETISLLVGSAVKFLRRQIIIEGQESQYVLAEYSTPADAAKAIEYLNGKELNGLCLRAAGYEPKNRRGGKGRRRRGRGKNLPENESP